jgi:hypothetical protein
MERRSFLLAAGVAAATFALAGAAWAHHGWGWATDEEFELTGTITKVRLGNPHGSVWVQADSGVWEVEVGQPWRNDRVGLTDKVLATGTTMTAHGHRSAKKDALLMKAERVVIDGKDYNLYPDRPS